jgi:hypothetical protein
MNTFLERFLPGILSGKRMVITPEETGYRGCLTPQVAALTCWNRSAFHLGIAEHLARQLKQETGGSVLLVHLNPATSQNRRPALARLTRSGSPRQEQPVGRNGDARRQATRL